jgi:hypothetical protein
MRQAAVIGGSVMTAPEVYPVMHALRDERIEVTAFHKHMLDDDPVLLHVFRANQTLGKQVRRSEYAMSV